jgi:hypothetical protein
MMGEIIEIFEYQAARHRAARRDCELQSLDRALAIMRENLAVAADDLRDAPAALQPELLDRIERLTALVRYGMRMMDDGGKRSNAGASSNR